MTEQELREKIIKALKRGGNMFHEYFIRSLNDAKESGKTHFGSKDCDKSMYDFFAEALIEDGIGDVSEFQKECDSKEDSYNNCYYDYKYWKDTAKKYKNRAEKAEKAFDSLVDEMYKNDIRPMCGKEFFKEARFEQAEKELQEERKDDR